MDDKIYELIKQKILELGKIIIDEKDNLGIENKNGNHNIVTKYDIMIEKELKDYLLQMMPDAGFMGEESDALNIANKEYVFIVDPIDGTTNFARNLKSSALSVALLKDSEPIMGICYNPFINELYEARKGNGAYLNGHQIYVSHNKLADGLVFCGSSPYYNELREKSLDLQKKLSLIASDYRRIGSAVIEICAVASGKAEMFYELKLMPWDYAAASLILIEAGGNITTIDGQKINYFEPTSVVATNNADDYLKYINEGE